MNDDLQSVVAAVVAAEGLDLEDVSLVGNDRQRTLRVVLDADGGVGIDAITAVSRALSRELDESVLMGERKYLLEVTSRGVSSPLTLPRHWRRNVGRLVKVRTVGGEALTGRVRAAGEEQVTLEVTGQAREIALAEVEKAIVQVELNRKDA